MAVVRPEPVEAGRILGVFRVKERDHTADGRGRGDKQSGEVEEEK